MAVESQPNDVYVAETLVAEFRRITPGNGHWTEVRHAEMPSYPPTEDFKMKMFGVETPALLLWIDRSTPPGDVNYERDLRIIVAGIVKQDRNLQQAVMRLANDLRGVMLGNIHRTFPGAALPNPTVNAITNELPEGIDFAMDRDPTGNTIGYFFSVWAISHRFPLPNG